MMMSQILKSVDVTKTKKPRYLKNETFFLQIKKFINYLPKATLWQKSSFVAEDTFKIGFLVTSRAAGLFPNFQYGFRSIWLLVGLLLLEL